MYDFIDTTTTSASGTVSGMPEALTFDGNCIDDIIPGYKTLHVSGREMLARDIQMKEIPTITGSLFTSEKLPPRQITVTYQLIAPSAEDFRDAFNRLMGLLARVQKRLIFADEPDKYFIGTMTSFEQPEPGTNSVVGSFTFTCPDPLKYALEETATQIYLIPKGDQSTSKMGEITIHNAGTVPVPVRFEMNMNADNGYLRVSGNWRNLMYGNSSEAESEIQPIGQYRVFDWTKFRQEWLKAGSDNTHTVSYGFEKPDEGYDGDRERWSWLRMSPGSHSKADWCRAYRSIAVPESLPSVKGNPPVQDFRFKSRLWFEDLLSRSAVGEIAIGFYGKDKSGEEKQICRFALSKEGTAFKAEAIAHVAGTKIKTESFTPDSTSPWGRGNRGQITIYRTGNKIYFRPKNGSAETWSATVPDSFNVPLTRIAISFGHKSGYEYFIRCYIKDAMLWAENVESVKENTFSPPAAGRSLKVTIDGEDSKFYVDDTPAPELEILGSRYFKTAVGDTTVSIHASSWYKGSIIGFAYHREAWL